MSDRREIKRGKKRFLPVQEKPDHQDIFQILRRRVSVSQVSIIFKSFEYPLLFFSDPFVRNPYVFCNVVKNSADFLDKLKKTYRKCDEYLQCICEEDLSENYEIHAHFRASESDTAYSFGIAAWPVPYGTFL